jgi:hypothetical protein
VPTNCNAKFEDHAFSSQLSIGLRVESIHLEILLFIGQCNEQCKLRKVLVNNLEIEADLNGPNILKADSYFAKKKTFLPCYKEQFGNDVQKHNSVYSGCPVGGLQTNTTCCGPNDVLFSFSG